MTDDLGGASESGKGSGDPFDIVLDENFVKGAAAKEPSARTRELSARWAKEPPKPTAWRGDSPDPLAGRAPRDDRSGDPWGGAVAPARRKRNTWVGYVFIAVVVAGVLGFMVYPRHHTPAPLDLSPAGTAQPWADGGGATPSPSFTNPDDRYFVDSPSLTWADNESGIVAPAATAVGSFSAAEVAAGYTALGKLLAAGNLDATVLDGGSLNDFTGLLDPSRPETADLSAWLAHPKYGADPIDLVTRFNPATTRLLGRTVKVSGTMTASIEHGRVLTVTGDYKFVYAVGPANPGDGTPSRAIVHRVYQIQLPSPGVAGPQQGKIMFYTYASDISNTACNTYNGYVNPQFGYGTSPRSGKTVDPYASANLLASPSGPAATASGAPTCDTVSQL